MYLNQNDLSKLYVLDSEGDGLEPTKFHCIVVKNIGTKERWRFYDHEGASASLSDFSDFVRSRGDVCWIGHNILSWDAPNFNRLLGTQFRLSTLIDTLVLSYLYYPAIPGGHSIRAWGERIGIEKLGQDIEDWSTLTPEMLARCERDMEIGERVFLTLTKRMRERGFSEKSCDIEHGIRFVVDQQQRNGFYFDIDAAKSLLAELQSKASGLTEEVQGLFPSTLVPVKRLEYRTTKAGRPYASYLKNVERHAWTERIGEEYVCYDYQDFNLGSPPQRLKRLMELGWQPTKRTKSGKSWKTDEDSVVEFAEKSGKAEVKALADWLVVNARSKMLKGRPDDPDDPTFGWIDYFNPATHAIHGKVFTCGAASRRMTHSSPNTANVPKAKEKVPYGIRSRGLWRARPGRLLVGGDAKSLEMRMFLHYLKASPELIALYLEGDPHQENADALSANPWDMPVDRDIGAKNGFYANIYGAQDPRLGDTVWPGRGTPKMGEWAREVMYSKIPGLEKLVIDIQQEYYHNDGFLSTIDGGFVRCPSPHSVLNYKCQPAGGIVMKQAAIFLHQRIMKAGLDSLKVGDIHDEHQLDTHPKDTQAVGDLFNQSLLDAGEELNFHLPIEGNFKIGETWADTH